MGSIANNLGFKGNEVHILSFFSIFLRDYMIDSSRYKSKNSEIGVDTRPISLRLLKRLRGWMLWGAFADILLLPLHTRPGNNPNTQEMTQTDTQTAINLVTLWLLLPCRTSRASTNTARSTPPPPWRIWQRQSSREKMGWRRGSQWGWLYSWLVHTACTVHQSYPERKKHDNVHEVSVFIYFTLSINLVDSRSSSSMKQTFWINPLLIKLL